MKKNLVYLPFSGTHLLYTSTDIRFIVVGRCNTYIKKPQQPLKKAKKYNDKKTPHFRVLRLIF